MPPIRAVGHNLKLPIKRHGGIDLKTNAHTANVYLLQEQIKIKERRRMLESIVGSFADQPSALLPINRRRRTPAMNPGTERMRRCFCAA
jgi:hypothetical protein